MDVGSLPGSLHVPKMGGHAECAWAIAILRKESLT